MACCMFGLLLIYQLIDAWQRVRRLGLRSWRALRGGLGWAGARRRTVWVAVLFFQLGFGAAFVEAHTAHLASVASHASADLGQLCRGAFAAVAVAATPGS